MKVAKYQKEYMNYIFKQANIRFLFFLIGIVTIGCTYIERDAPFLTSFYNTLSNSWCFCITSILSCLIMNLNISYHIESQEVLGLYFLNRKKLLKEQFCMMFKSNSIFFVFNIIIAFIGTNIFSKGYLPIGIQNHGGVTYDIPNIVYLMFFLFRMFFISQLLAMINVGISKLISSKWIYVINIVIMANFLSTDFIVGEVISSTTQIKIFPTEYMMLLAYKSFSFEVFCSCLYMGILFLIFLAILFIVLKKGYDIGK